MVKVRRANVILDIEDDENQIERYLAKGYSVVDNETEQVIREAIPFDTNELRSLVVKQNAEIEELQKRIAELESVPEAKSVVRRKRKKLR
jgi:BMFP domain-containing protein YqiC